MVFEAETDRDFLTSELDRRIKVNPRYSLRAYARALRMSSGALSEILRGRRSLTLRGATKVARALGMTATESMAFYELIHTDKRRELGDRERQTDEISGAREKRLSEDVFEAVSEWQHFAILNLLDCCDFRWESSYVACLLTIGRMSKRSHGLHKRKHRRSLSNPHRVCACG